MKDLDGIGGLVPQGELTISMPWLPLHARLTRFLGSVTMRLERRLRRLLRKRGIRLTEELRQGVRDFVATVCEQNPDVLDAEASEEDEEGSSDEPALEHRISCPHCGETIPIAIDLSGDEQDDVQDCTVCCSPIHVTYSVRGGRLYGFQSEPC